MRCIVERMLFLFFSDWLPDWQILSNTKMAAAVQQNLLKMVSAQLRNKANEFLNSRKYANNLADILQMFEVSIAWLLVLFRITKLRHRLQFYNCLFPFISGGNRQLLAATAYNWSNIYRIIETRRFDWRNRPIETNWWVHYTSGLGVFLVFIMWFVSLLLEETG